MPSERSLKEAQNFNVHFTGADMLNGIGCTCSRCKTLASLIDRERVEAVHEGHNHLCYYCGAPCNNLAANPGLWAVGLCHANEPGVVKWHHGSCVSERLAVGAEIERKAKVEALKWALTEMSNNVGSTVIAIRAEITRLAEGGNDAGR
jgi:hypothetical protein